MSTVVVKSFEHNPIFRVSSLLGLFPFKNKTFDFDVSLFIYSFTLVAAVTVVGGLSMLDDLTPLLTQSYNQAIILAYIAGLIIVFPCSVVCAFLKREVAQQTFREIKDMQITFEKKIKLPTFNKWTNLLPLLDISVPVICILLIYATNGSTPGTAFGTFYGFALLGMALICGQLSFLVDIVGDIFEAGIDFLNEMKLSLVIKRHSDRISELVKATNRLGSVSFSLNEVYSDQILVMMSLCFCGFSIHLYYITMFAAMPLKLELLLPQVYSVLFYFYVSWRVNQSSAETSGKSKEFNTLLYQLMIDDKTNEILHNDKLRLHISMKREVVFTACGFFNLDYTLVHSMIASATTYLVILIQFGRPEPAAPISSTNHTTSTTDL